MASHHFSTLLLLLPLLLLFITPTHSLTCSNQTFTNNNLYTNCTDLPTLNSTLHYTYHPTNSSLSIAFIAPPAKPTGWIAWAINPTGSGMLGAQALIAFRQSNGSMAVKTYNITSYEAIVESKILFNVVRSTGEYSDGVMRIFATLVLPENLTTLNQVWQVGGEVVNGVPKKHEFAQGNLNAKGTLDLVKAQNNATTGGGGSGGRNSTSGGGQNGADNTAGVSSIKGEVGFYVILLLVGSFGLVF